MPLRELKSTQHADPLDAKINLTLQGTDQNFWRSGLFVLSKRSAESGSVVNISVLVFLLPSAIFILAEGGLGVKK